MEKKPMRHFYKDMAEKQSGIKEKLKIVDDETKGRISGMFIDKVTASKLDKYLGITNKALNVVRASGVDESRKPEALDMLSMAENYYSDALHFKQKGDWVNALAAASYAHAWLDAGARLKLFKVKDEKLFASD